MLSWFGFIETSSTFDEQIQENLTLYEKG